MKKNRISNESFIDLGVVDMVPMSESSCRIVDENIFSLSSEDQPAISVGIIKSFPDSVIPEYKTERSACFDLEVYLGDNVNQVKVYETSGNFALRNIGKFGEESKRGIFIYPGERALLPTGIIFDIPEGFEIDVFPRSGAAIERGLTLINCTGIIDEDYTQMLYVLLINSSQQKQIIYHRDRVAQAKIIPYLQATFVEIQSIEQKTNRVGGMGSTGR